LVANPLPFSPCSSHHHRYVINNFETCDTSLLCTTNGGGQLDIQSAILQGCSLVGNYTANFTQLPGTHGLPTVPGGASGVLAGLDAACSSDMLAMEGCSQILLQVFGGDRVCNLPSKWVNFAVVLGVAFGFRLATFLAFRLRKVYLKTFT